MKKIFSLLAVVALAGMAFTSCDDGDTTNDIPIHSLSVVSAETSYSAPGGTGTITVAENVASAYSNDPWITTAPSGNTVTLTVSPNNSKESRHTTVVVKASNQDSAVVNIDQKGSIFSTTLPQGLHIANAGQTLKYTYTADETPKVVSSSDWVTATASDGTLTVNVAANNVGPRRDTLTITSGINTYTSVIAQYDFDTDIAGDYYLLDGDSLMAGSMYGIPAQIAADANGQVSISIPSQGFTLPVTWNDSGMALTMRAGTSVGTYTEDSTTYYVFADVIASDGYIYWGNSVTYTAPFEYDPEYDELMAFFEDDGTISSSTYILGIEFDVFSASTVSNDAYVGGLMYFGNPILYKLPSGSSAKAKAYSPRHGRAGGMVSGKLTGPLHNMTIAIVQ